MTWNWHLDPIWPHNGRSWNCLQTPPKILRIAIAYCVGRDTASDSPQSSWDRNGTTGKSGGSCNWQQYWCCEYNWQHLSGHLSNQMRCLRVFLFHVNLFFFWFTAGPRKVNKYRHYRFEMIREANCFRIANVQWCPVYQYIRHQINNATLPSYAQVSGVSDRNLGFHVQTGAICCVQWQVTSVCPIKMLVSFLCVVFRLTTRKEPSEVWDMLYSHPYNVVHIPLGNPKMKPKTENVTPLLASAAPFTIIIHWQQRWWTRGNIRWT